MEVFYFHRENVIPAEKSRINGLRENIKKLFRVVEISLVLISLTWASNRLSFAVKISGDFFRQLINVVVGHLFIFLLSNVIVLTLFLKGSRHHQQDFQNTTTTEIDFCRDFIDNIDGGGGGTPHSSGGESPPPPPEEVVYQDKQTILEVSAGVKVHHRRSHHHQSKNIINASLFVGEDCDDGDDECGGGCEQSETEERWRGVVEEEAEMVADDELSNEEFQRTIEAFIAKQVEFHQQEKMAIVLHG